MANDKISNMGTATLGNLSTKLTSAFEITTDLLGIPTTRKATLDVVSQWLCQTGGLNSQPIALGPITAVGAATFSSTVAITGAVTSGTINGQMINATAALTGTLSVAGATTIGGTLQFPDGYAVQWASANNRAFFNGGDWRLDVNGTQRHAITAAGAHTLTGAVTLSSTLSVAGATTLRLTTVDANGDKFDVGRTGANPSLDFNVSTGNNFRFLTAAGGPAPLTSGTINGQAINATAALTGTLSVAGAVTATGGISITATNAASLGLASGSGANQLRFYGGGGATHQWDVYLTGNNIRFSDNTSGGVFVVDTAATVGSTLSVAGAAAVGGATVSASTGLITPTGTTALSSLRIPHGAAPTSPVDGDVWSTTTTLNFRLNGVTKSVTLV